jgi:hypothetical protein
MVVDQKYSTTAGYDDLPKSMQGGKGWGACLGLEENLGGIFGHFFRCILP